MIESIKNGSFILLLMGWAFILSACVPLIYTLMFRWGAKVSHGRVVRIEIIKNRHGGIIGINPIVKFLTFRGEEFELKTGVSHWQGRMPKEGDTAKVYYRPENPQKYQIGTWMRWIIIGVFILSGLLMMLMAAFISATDTL